MTVTLSDRLAEQAYRLARIELQAAKREYDKEQGYGFVYTGTWFRLSAARKLVDALERGQDGSGYDNL